MRTTPTDEARQPEAAESQATEESPHARGEAGANPNNYLEEEDDMAENGHMGIDPNLLLAKMSNGKDDDKTLWLFLLLLLYGRRGFGDADGEGVRDVARVSDLNALQNALQSCLTSMTAAVTERTYDITRDQSANALRNESGQARIQEIINSCCFAVQSGQSDIRQAIADCCCRLGLEMKDVQRAVSDCCCQLGLGQKDILRAITECCCKLGYENAAGFAAVQNAICQQTNDLTTAIKDDGRATRELITHNRMDDLQAQLQVCRDENSNLRQTNQILDAIRAQCGHHHDQWGPHAAAVAAAAKK